MIRRLLEEGVVVVCADQRVITGATPADLMSGGFAEGPIDDRGALPGGEAGTRIALDPVGAATN